MSQDSYTDQLRVKGSHIASDIAGIGSVLKEAASEKLHSIKDATLEKVSAIKDGAVGRVENARDAVKGAVTGSPWRSMFVAAGVGAGVGVLAGMFLRRR
ncbi:MAG: hypothetical protein AAB074_16685 [Planctomycetota bacterium]